MYTVSHPVSAPLNGMGSSMMDPSGTINPAALSGSGLSYNTNKAAVLPNTGPSIIDQTPRGVKRERSPAHYGDAGLGEGGDEDENKPRKRGRPPKVKVPESPAPAQPQHQQSAVLPPQHMPPPVQTPQIKTQGLPAQASPTHLSPPKSTPTKPTVVKALPTVRDHTTDQLNPEGDEYIPREYDDAGEKKVTPTGHILDGREYRCRTFYVPNRGNKLFMLATECARVLGYRDSYLLFNKNRSLYKIIATQAEKDDLIHQEILPYSYRSRQIAIVTARSMFRQFGSRLIVNGRRVRDDYWESKARKQGFTEEDAAGEKRPGGAKQREAAAAEAQNAALAALPHGEIIYSNGPGPLEGHPPGPVGINAATLAPLPMINLAPTDDLRPRDYGNVVRPRQEISGAPYQDRTQPSNQSEILGQAAQTAEYNRAITQQRTNRGKYLDDYWNRPREQPVAPAPAQQTGLEADVGAVSQSPQPASTPSVIAPGQQSIVPHQSQNASQMMNAQGYQQQPHQQNPIAQSPIRSMHQPIRPDQMHHRSPSLGMSSTTSHSQQSASYGHPQSQMWPPPQPQPSPLSQSHTIPQYPQHAQQSPISQQSPMQHGHPQLAHQQSSGGSMHGTPMGYQSMGPMNPSGYPGMTRNPYQPSPTPQHYMQHTSAGQQPGMQGWAPHATHGQPGWQGY